MTQFSGEIEPRFSRFPDQQLAQAVSELIIRLSDFKVISEGVEPEDFPPEPAYLSIMQIAYLETAQDETRVRRQLVALDQDSNALKAFSEAYEARMRPVQEIMPEILTPEKPSTNELLEIAPTLSAKVGLRTIANFVLFRSQQNPSRFYKGLIIPKNTIEKAPLEFRNFYISLMGQIGGKESLKKHSKHLTQRIQEMLNL